MRKWSPTPASTFVHFFYQYRLNTLYLVWGWISCFPHLSYKKLCTNYLLSNKNLCFYFLPRRVKIDILTQLVNTVCFGKVVISLVLFCNTNRKKVYNENFFLFQKICKKNFLIPVYLENYFTCRIRKNIQIYKMFSMYENFLFSSLSSFCPKIIN